MDSIWILLSLPAAQNHTSNPSVSWLEPCLPSKTDWPSAAVDTSHWWPIWRIHHWSRPKTAATTSTWPKCWSKAADPKETTYLSYKTWLVPNKWRVSELKSKGMAVKCACSFRFHHFGLEAYKELYHFWHYSIQISFQCQVPIYLFLGWPISKSSHDHLWIKSLRAPKTYIFRGFYSK